MLAALTAFVIVARSRCCPSLLLLTAAQCNSVENRTNARRETQPVDTDALALRIRHGEDSRLELKRVQFSGTRIAAPKRSDLADEMAAMANTSGGAVVLGVDDKTRSLLGIPPGKFDIVEEWIVGICENSIEPPLDMETHKVELHEDGGGGALLVVVEIERSLFCPQEPRRIFPTAGQLKTTVADGGSGPVVSGTESNAFHSLRRDASTENLNGPH